MSDPFGALATQRKGDMGVFDGTQWSPSSQGQQVPASMISPQAVPIQNATVNSGDMLQIIQGSAAKPAATQNATLYVSREMAVSTAGDNNAAIWGEARNSGTSQPSAFHGDAINSNTTSGDACAYYGTTTAKGGNAYGAFFSAGASTNSTGAVGVNTFTVSDESKDFTFSADNATNIMAGVMIQKSNAGTTGHNWKFGAAVLLQSNDPANSIWDVGIGIQRSTIASDVIFDGSDATNFYATDKTHTNLFDLSATGAVFTAHFKLNAAAFIVTSTRTANPIAAYLNAALTNSYVQTVMGAAQSTGNCLVTTYANNATPQYASFDTFGLSSSLKVDAAGQVSIASSGWTAGANLTPLFMLEGVTPTLRQLKTFDPGAAGINFTAGQLVCVLV